jgi:hypothetical protein
MDKQIDEIKYQCPFLKKDLLIKTHKELDLYSLKLLSFFKENYSDEFGVIEKNFKKLQYELFLDDNKVLGFKEIFSSKFNRDFLIFKFFDLFFWIVYTCSDQTDILNLYSPFFDDDGCENCFIGKKNFFY